VEIDVIERIRGDGVQDQIRGAMGGEADMTDAVLQLPAPDHIKATARPDGPMQVLRQIDAVDCQQINALDTKPFKAELKLVLKGGWILPGWHFGLQDPHRVGSPGECPADLTLGTAVMPSRLEVVQTLARCGLDGGFQGLLRHGGDRVSREISPALLKTHAPE